MIAEAALAGAVVFLAGAAPASKAFDGIVKQAVAAREAGSLDAAAAHYRRALRLKPDWTEGHWGLGTVLYDLDRYAEAHDHFRRVVAARPEDGVALALKALCDVRLGDHDLAFADLQRARVLGVPNAQVQSVAAFHFALLLNRAGSPDAAFEILRGFAREGSDSPAVITAFGLSMLRLRWMPEDVPADKLDMIQLAGRGGYHMARGRRTAVGRLGLEELVSRYPAEPNVHYALGTYIAPEEPDAAIAEFRKELGRDPQHYPALLQMASLELKGGHADQARALAESASRLAPAVPASWLMLGRACLETGDTKTALEALERGAALAPESRDMHFFLARAYQRAGREEDAERARQEFLRLEKLP